MYHAGNEDSESAIFSDPQHPFEDLAESPRPEWYLCYMSVALLCTCKISLGIKKNQVSGPNGCGEE